MDVMRLLFSLIVLLLCGCQPATPPQLDQQVSYQVSLDGHQLTYSPARLPVESLLTLTLVPKQPVTSVSGTIEGISNYMGLIPLSFSYDSTSKTWQSQFMLGACTEPDMRWRLKLELKTVTGQIILLEDHFTSSLY